MILPVLEAVKFTEKQFDARVAAELPRIQFADSKAEEQALDSLYERGVRHAVAGNLGGLWRAREHGFTRHGDWGLNVLNTEALEACASLGCADVCLSFEANLAELKRLGGAMPRGIFAYGRLPLMTVRCCPAKAERGCALCPGTASMRDRLGNVFTVSCGGTREQTEIYNCIPLYLADRLPELDKLDFFTLWFTTETPEQCACVLRAYQNGKKREGMTRGLYYRNIM